MEFGKVNVDEWPELSQQYRVRSIPTMIIFRNGKTVTRIDGFHPESRLRPHLERYALPPRERPQPEPAAGSSLSRLLRRFAR
jgi:thioredoxin-like negative regulator of GroEL